MPRMHGWKARRKAAASGKTSIEELRDEVRRTYAKANARRERARMFEIELNDGREFIERFKEREPFLVSEIPKLLDGAGRLADRVGDLEDLLEIARQREQVKRLKDKITSLERELKIESEGGSITKATTHEEPSLDLHGDRLD